MLDISSLKLSDSTSDNITPTKSLLFKTKTKSSPPVFVIALHSTSTPSGVIASSTKTKDPRLASEDLIAEIFSTTKEFISPLSLTAENAKKVSILVDKALFAADKTLIFVESDGAKKTAVLSGSEIFDHLKEVVGEENFQVVDFAATAATPKQEVSKAAATPAESGKLDNAALIGITVDKNIDFSSWYQQVVTKAELLDYYDVSGCYIMRPASYSIWEKIQAFFDEKIKSIGVQNTYFPMFVSRRVLEKEKDHIEGFAPEVAWVTKAGSSDLDEPIAIRPTSETVMYPYYAKWIRSHRDLPLRLNQWNSVVRWEFKHPQPFLRTREFLWQEGHTAHLTFEDANEEVLQILDWYAAVYEELLAVPIVKGKKTTKEKFAGSFFTTTVEGYIPTTGRGIQGGTSHCLGQNFSKMFNISVENPEGPDKPKLFAWQNSWGLSTRVIGVMIMVHSDNKGLVLPPRVAQTQATVIPVGITAKTSPEERKNIGDHAKEVELTIRKAGVRVNGDYRDNYSPGWKFADAELHGTPLRVEIGPQDIKKKQVTVVRRDNGAKLEVSLDSVATVIPTLLEEIQANLYAKAKASFDSHIVRATQLDEFIPALNNKNVLLAPFCGDEECEDNIKEKSGRQPDDVVVDDKAPSMGAKSLCIPFEQPALAEGTKCVGACGKDAQFYTLFGRSY